MAKTFLQVQNQIAQLQRQADQLRKKEADGVLSRIKEAISVYGFTAEELGFGKGRGKAVMSKEKGTRKPQKTKKTIAAARVPKYKDDQGNVWSGRGPRPLWFKAALEAGKLAEDLLA
ncbi:H-NS histone family protein [Variovorax sp. EBFNA2]|uniref:H-NS histone family protein n=1 Tax=Variovorax sp. EBFNA2 TaxID=3342097 RepID=UPI0029C0DE38|nr:H-NS histone family protein [Variovorax boronicumulans]WPG41112.1 H-NS histone family protein [Variovorax boronicumulans]